jgi:hypothetical protein
MAHDLEEVWRIREEDIYPALFGPLARGIFPLTAELFANRFNRSEIDPRWLTYGVLEFGPTAQRPFWLYVTSAHSNPWDIEPADYDPMGLSGSGVEFLFAAPEQADWPIVFLQNMLAFDLLLAAGHFAGRGPLEFGDRVPLGASIDGSDSAMCTVLVALTDKLPAGFELPSGRVEFLTFVGITDAELAFAKRNGSDQLLSKLYEASRFLISDPRRPSVPYLWP